jgi:AcrR family transcriptional regulator
MPKIIDHDRYRSELIEGCRGLFAQRGYRALSMREIAAALGVSTGTLYHYFPDKRSLFTQCVEATTQDDALHIADLDRSAPPTERLAALLQFMGAREREFLDQIVTTIDYYQEQALEPPPDEPIRVGIRRDRRAIAELLGLNDHDTTTLILSQIIGLIVLRLFEGETRPFADQTALLQHLIADHLRESSES